MGVNRLLRCVKWCRYGYWSEDGLRLYNLRGEVVFELKLRSEVTTHGH